MLLILLIMSDDNDWLDLIQWQSSHWIRRFVDRQSPLIVNTLRDGWAWFTAIEDPDANDPCPGVPRLIQGQYFWKTRFRQKLDKKSYTVTAHEPVVKNNASVHKKERSFSFFMGISRRPHGVCWISHDGKIRQNLFAWI